MGFIAALISCALCAVVYVRMIRREVPFQIGGAQAWVPVGVGLIAPIIASMLAIAFGMLTIVLRGQSLGAISAGEQIQAQSSLSLPMRSLIDAFRLAGFTEELVKLGLALVMVAVFKPRNVYEYALAFIGVGVGFTALEEVLYGGGLMSLFRLPGFAMHMVFGMVMGVFLGLGRYEKRQGRSPLKYTLLGLVLPVLWHTLYDAATVSNAGLDSTDEKVQETAIIVAAVTILVSTVLQFVVLFRFKKMAVPCSEKMLV